MLEMSPVVCRAKAREPRRGAGGHSLALGVAIGAERHGDRPVPSASRRASEGYFGVGQLRNELRGPRDA